MDILYTFAHNFNFQYKRFEILTSENVKVGQ